MGRRVLPNIPMEARIASEIFKGFWGASDNGISLGGIKIRLVENSDVIPALYVDGSEQPAPVMAIILFEDGAFNVAEFTEEAKLTNRFRFALLIARED